MKRKNNSPVCAPAELGDEQLEQAAGGCAPKELPDSQSNNREYGGSGVGITIDPVSKSADPTKYPDKLGGN